MMVRRVVDLPAPLRPTSTVARPALTFQGHSLEDVVLLNVGVDILECRGSVSVTFQPPAQIGFLHFLVLGDGSGGPSQIRRRS